MWYSYQQSVEMFWKERADELFAKAWVSKWRQKMSEEEKKEKEYIKLTEDAHGKILHKYLDDLWITHTHIWNESGQSWSKNIIIMMAKKKALWVSKWFPDYIVYIPYKEWLITLYIELKKAPWKQWGWNWSTFKLEQAEWLNTLQQVPLTWVALCKWSEQAMNLIDMMINQLKNIDTMQVLSLWNDREIIDYTTIINE